jgi:hypothetical protein
VRAELGYAVILDIGQSAAIVAADKNLNISDRVIAKLRTMPVPVIVDKSAATKAADTKGGAKAPAGGPVAAPAGIGSKGAAAPAGKATDTKKADSTAKKADSTTKKDSVPPRRPPTQ